MGLSLNSVIDEVVGEIDESNVTTIFGPPGVGKSTMCFLYSIECLKNNKKVVYIDTEAGFSAERLKQLDKNVDLKNIVVYSPKNFEEQAVLMSKLEEEIEKIGEVGLLVIDSLVMLYRLKMGKGNRGANKLLYEQLSKLTKVALEKKIPVIVTNQMYRHFETKKNKMVGGLVLEYWAKSVIEMSENDEGEKHICLLKHKYRKTKDKKKYVIEEKGFVFC